MRTNDFVPRERFATVWKSADTPVAASCFCRLDVAAAGGAPPR